LDSKKKNVGNHAFFRDNLATIILISNYEYMKFIYLNCGIKKLINVKKILAVINATDAVAGH